MSKRITLKFVALGDSLTVGFQPPSAYLPGNEEFPYNHFLEIILDKELPLKGLSHVEVDFINAGMLGDTSKGMLERFDLHVSARKPDYVIVWGGINDLFMLRDPEAVLSNLRRIYEKAREAKIEPIACTVTPTLGHDDLLPQIVKLNDLIKKHCRENNILLADLYSVVADESGRLRESFSSDGVHLSYAGYQRIAYALYYEVIEKILDKLKNMERSS